SAPRPLRRSPPAPVPPPGGRTGRLSSPAGEPHRPAPRPRRTPPPASGRRPLRVARRCRRPARRRPQRRRAPSPARRRPARAGPPWTGGGPNRPPPPSRRRPRRPPPWPPWWPPPRPSGPASGPRRIPCHRPRWLRAPLTSRVSCLGTTPTGATFQPALSGLGAAAAPLGSRLDPGHERRVDLLEHHGAVDDALADVVARRQLVHHVEQHLFEDGPQTPGARPPQERLVGHRPERVLGELQFHVVELEELLELLGQGVLRLHEDPDERLLVEAVDGADDRQPADELRDEPELQQVFRENL